MAFGCWACHDYLSLSKGAAAGRFLGFWDDFVCCCSFSEGAMLGVDGSASVGVASGAKLGGNGGGGEGGAGLGMATSSKALGIGLET